MTGGKRLMKTNKVWCRCSRSLASSAPQNRNPAIKKEQKGLVSFMFILLSREEAPGCLYVGRWVLTRLGGFRFQGFGCCLKSCSLLLLLVVFHQAEISNLSKDATTRRGRGLNQIPCDPGRRKNGTLNHSATQPTKVTQQRRLSFWRDSSFAGIKQALALIFSSFKLLLELEPNVREIVFAFYKSQYARCLTLLQESRDNFLLDLYISPHLDKLYTQIRCKALVQVPKFF